jgi:hypothetical protein
MNPFIVVLLYGHMFVAAPLPHTTTLEDCMAGVTRMSKRLTNNFKLAPKNYSFKRSDVKFACILSERLPVTGA